MSGRCPKIRKWLARFVEPPFAKTYIRVLIVRSEIEIVLDQKCACKGVIADSVSAHPRIHQWQRAHEKEQQRALPAGIQPKRLQQPCAVLHMPSICQPLLFPAMRI